MFCHFIHTEQHCRPDDVFFEMLSFEMPFMYGIAMPEPTPIPIEPKDPVDIDKGVSDRVKIELLNVGESGNIDLFGDQPKILIYHTHTTEAYTPTRGYEYKETSKWRTDDNTKNIVAVGKKLASLLHEKYGIQVIHDTTDHEPPKLATSYSRSVLTMEKYKQLYPSITMFIDVHRDAYGKGENGIKDVAVINGKEVARLMFVVGTGEGATGKGFDEMPDFVSNYALAKRLTQWLTDCDEKLTRNIRVKTGRYNQHISSQCLLVEVGHNANSLEQALNATEYLAAAIAEAAGIDVGEMLNLAA